MPGSSVYPTRKDGRVDKRYKPPTEAQKKKHPRYKNAKAPKGHAWCTQHQRYEPIEVDGKSNFSKNRANSNGLNSRCRQGQKEYRLEFEAKYGTRQDKTKTIRMSPTVHTFFKKICEQIDLSMEQNIAVAIRFWAQYACKHPKCTKPKGARFERCDEHALALLRGQGRAS